MLTDKEKVSFWAGYIVQLRNINIITKRAGKYNDEVMEDLLEDLCNVYNVDKSILDDLDYEYTINIPKKLIERRFR